MRIVKEHDVRKKEILDKAANLFVAKGYSKSTVNDIINAVGIAKGTFYYYFKSKEEVMDALIMNFVSYSADIIAKNVNEPGKTAMQKFKDINDRNYRVVPGFNEMFLELQYSNNAEMQYKVILKTIKKISPLLARLVRQGIAEGVFKTEYPDEFAELLMLFSQFIFENDVFGFSAKTLGKKAKATASFMENILGVKKGSFDFVAHRYANLNKKNTKSPHRNESNPIS
ncbi:MAG: TetR/AcrR family transcriptional regulator [Elusimicrobiota bacterium]|jgi:AcrR family transcriptional regulator|nr:TetR/AcrR family transcriptional regulator [Elusimicrobiota bacterium]